MKRIKKSKVFIYKALLSLSLSLLALTHEVKAENISAGPKVGVAFSGVAGYIYPGINLGFVGGVGVMAEVVTGLSFGGDLFYDHRGATFAPGTQILNTLELRYLDIYLNMKASIKALENSDSKEQARTYTEPGEIRTDPYILISPQFAILLSAEDCLFRTDICKDVGGNFNSIDLGIGLGAGIDIIFGKVKALLEGRYVIGLLDISEFVGSQKNRALLLLLGVGYSF